MGALRKSRPNIHAQKELAKVIATERPLALVGAGLSVAAGLPTWPTLMKEMHHHLPSDLNSHHRKALEKETDLLWRAQEYFNFMGEQPFQDFMRKRFGGKLSLKSSNPALALVKLPFRHFMTTNYDDVLMIAHKTAKLPLPRRLNWSNPDDVRTFIASLRNTASERLLLHLHGHHSEPKTIVLTDNHYTEQYVRTIGTARRLFAIFAIERVVFVGFSLNDPDLMTLLREVNATMQSKEPRHFAIMGLEHPISEPLERNRLRNRYGVEPVFYDNREQTHAGLLDILADLAHHGVENVPAVDQFMPHEDRLSIRESTSEFDPDDPQKGLWGGKDNANGRKVTATVRELEPGWFEATIKVQSTQARRPLSGDVMFYLHPTLIPPVRSSSAVRGVATIKVESYGAYTLGVSADGGATRLELDLATLEGAPLLFRLN
jgi:hypothetical protein